jgi:hypothetical protein
VQSFSRYVDYILLYMAGLVLGQPWIVTMDPNASQALLVSSIVTGLLIFLLAGWALYKPATLWPDWAIMVLGAWVVISPWVLGFTGPIVPGYQVVVGIAVIVLALIDWRIATNASHAAVTSSAS